MDIYFRKYNTSIILSNKVLSKVLNRARAFLFQTVADVVNLGHSLGRVILRGDNLTLASTKFAR